MADDLLTNSELAAYLRISLSTLYGRRYRGESMPKSISIGGKTRYRRSDVEQWLEEQEEELTPS